MSLPNGVGTGVGYEDFPSFSMSTTPTASSSDDETVASDDEAIFIE